MTGPRLLFSASEDYLETARKELAEQFPDAAFGAVGPDLGWISAEGLSIGGLADACRAMPSMFVRHLMREVAMTPLAVAQELDSAVDAAMEAWTRLPLRPDVALQVWVSGESALPYRTDELRLALAEALSDEGTAVERSGQEHILSAVVTPEGIGVGMNGLANALSDWPGGRVRLAKPKGQISRSEFKLEELFREHNLQLPTEGIAIDLGASPGGWTRILRQRGLTVWAVDPGTLDSRLQSDAGVNYVRMNAGPFLRMTDLLADLVVNDMRMITDLSAEIMLDAAHRLKPGGMTIQTLKVTPHNTLRTVRRALDALGDAYDIVWAGQLHHNRNEVTVVGKKRS